MQCPWGDSLFAPPVSPLISQRPMVDKEGRAATSSFVEAPNPLICVLKKIFTSMYPGPNGLRQTRNIPPAREGERETERDRQTNTHTEREGGGGRERWGNQRPASILHPSTGRGSIRHQAAISSRKALILSTSPLVILALKSLSLLASLGSDVWTSLAILMASWM